MKFLLRSTSGAERLGIISNLARLPNFQMETPNALLYTQGGTVPHLSYEVLQILTTQNLGLSIPIQQIAKLQGRLKESNLNISEFVGMKDYVSYMTFIDSGQKRIGGFHEKKKIPVWTKCGKKLFTSEEYMLFVEELKPDIFSTLGDGDTDLSSSKKRTDKAFVESKDHFEKCMELYEKSETLKNSQILGALEGGFNLNNRESFSKLVGENNSVFGVVIDGLHDCSSSVIEMDSKQITEVVQASLKYIPKEKLRVIHGSWNPKVLLDLVELGIDVFDTSYPFYITEEGGALTFPNSDQILNQSVLNGVNGISEVLKDHNHEVDESINEGPALKRIKLTTKSIYHMSMLNTAHKTDFTPISEKCTCYTCKNHTKGYIHHLILVEELLGRTLLMIHNLHHYYLFLSSIRKAISNGKFQEFKELFTTWSIKSQDGISLT